MTNNDARVWVFNAEGSRFPGGVFSTRELAEEWVAKHALSGVLTAYPVDSGVYEWAIAGGFFKAEKQVDPPFIGRFSSAHQEHHHYVDGAAE